MMWCRFTFAFAWVLITGAVLAQQSTVSNRFVPDDAIMMIQVRPQSILQHPSMELAPTEVFSAASREYIGVDIGDVVRTRAVIGMPGQMGPEFGVVIELSQPVTIDMLNERLVDPDSGEETDEGTFYMIPDGPPGAILAEVDPKTWILGTRAFVSRMVRSENNEGPLPHLASQTQEIGEMQVLIAIEPVRPMLAAMVAQATVNLPPPLQSLSELPELVDSVVIQYYASKGFAADMTFHAKDDSSAEDVARTLNDAKDFGRQSILQMIPGMIQDDGPVADAMRAYGVRLTNTVFAMVKPERSGAAVKLDIAEIKTDVATTGTLIALLLPAIQSARQAARRTSCMNNLKMLALAVHNYHDTYGHFPTNIKDDDGNALLSWRVQLLPFMDSALLYDQFHLDEPWDSEHNRTLIEQMPSTLACPDGLLEPGTTTYQIPLGEGIGLLGDEPLGFRDILDGTSNTILFLETSDERAVTWTKPDDWEYDPEAPLDGLETNHVGGLNVAIMDGSVRFITSEIDVNTWKALLTRAGREQLQDF